MPQTTSFFGLAALLIPVLLFTGFATERLREPTPLLMSFARGTAGRDLLRQGAVLVAFGFFPAFAELIALNAVLNGGEVDTFYTSFVATAVAFGMWSVAGAIVWPWLRVVWSYSRTLKAVICVGVLGLLLGSVAVLRTGVEVQRLRVENEQAMTRAEQLNAHANLVVSPFVDSAVAASEVAEALLREKLVGASRKRRTELRRSIGEILRLRFEALTERAAYENERLDEQSKQLEESAQELKGLAKKLEDSSKP